MIGATPGRWTMYWGTCDCWRCQGSGSWRHIRAWLRPPSHVRIQKREWEPKSLEGNLGFGFLLQAMWVWFCSTPFMKSTVCTSNLGPVHIGSQVPLLLASTNMEAKSQLLSLKTPLEYGYLSLKLDLDYFMQKYLQGLRWELWSGRTGS